VGAPHARRRAGLRWNTNVQADGVHLRKMVEQVLLHAYTRGIARLLYTTLLCSEFPTTPWADAAL
jgi:hypothetical protein